MNPRSLTVFVLSSSISLVIISFLNSPPFSISNFKSSKVISPRLRAASRALRSSASCFSDFLGVSGMSLAVVGGTLFERSGGAKGSCPQMVIVGTWERKQVPSNAILNRPRKGRRDTDGRKIPHWGSVSMIWIQRFDRLVTIFSIAVSRFRMPSRPV